MAQGNLTLGSSCRGNGIMPHNDNSFLVSSRQSSMCPWDHDKYIRLSGLNMYTSSSRNIKRRTRVVACNDNLNSAPYISIFSHGSKGAVETGLVPSHIPANARHVEGRSRHSPALSVGADFGLADILRLRHVVKLPREYVSIIPSTPPLLELCNRVASVIRLLFERTRVFH